MNGGGQTCRIRSSTMYRLTKYNLEKKKERERERSISQYVMFYDKYIVFMINILFLVRDVVQIIFGCSTAFARETGTGSS